MSSITKEEEEILRKSNLPDYFDFKYMNEPFEPGEERKRELENEERMRRINERKFQEP